MLNSWPFLFIVVATCYLHTTHSVSPHDQTSLLLDLKTSLQYDTSKSTKLVTWDADHSDCCHWSGVECDDTSTSEVVALDLSSEGINNTILSSSALFRLHSLRSLNLADNDITGFPSSDAFRNLPHLTYLNLSDVGYFDSVPVDTSYLQKLEVLDLSVPGYYTCTGDLEKIIRNSSNIRELYLDGVSISSETKAWGDMLSLWLPNLQVLSMTSCNLTGEIPRSLSTLHSLSIIRLDSNNFSAAVPEFLAGFKNLTTLSLHDCGLFGAVPPVIFQISTLTTLDLSENDMLQGSLPEFPINSPIQNLQLTSTNLSGTLPPSIGHLTKLRTLSMSDCNFHGIIPPSVAKLNQLESMILSSNKFSGAIPSFSRMKRLAELRLQENRLTGSITSTDWGGLRNLIFVDLSNNLLTGNVPASLFSVPSIQEIYLQLNKFSGVLDEFVSVPLSELKSLDLSRNDIEGQVPKSIFLSKDLEHLDLSWNHFNGTLELNKILSKLQNLLHLDLSYNKISISSSGTVENILFPQLNFLYMASCNLSVIPEFLRNQSRLVDVDLSNNQIKGRVPNWIWKLADGIHDSYAGFRLLNLSCNAFFEVEQPLPTIVGLTILDLHSNNLKGQVPVFPSKWNLRYLDLSNNSFTSIHPRIGDTVSNAIFFSLARNKIHGRIPKSLCNATRLEVLELEYNHLYGTIPECLVSIVPTLAVLNLRGNTLGGSLPNEFGKDCELETLDVNGNALQGQIPRSLDNCRKLRVLDLGNNKLHDQFPCQLRNSSTLQVLILRSNKFHGPVACAERNAVWPLLQIVDLASNNFSGELSPNLLRNWKSMMDETSSKASHLAYTENMVNVYYQDQVTINYKSSNLELQKILSIFTSIDLSDNAFRCVLPGELEGMTGLKGLNLSRNFFSGEIPRSIGKLHQLESLDLSFNTLTGNIPQELTNLNFLQVLNLSFNNFQGQIPTGTQLQARDASSYMGNSGLCGPPLLLSCNSRNGPGATTTDGSTWNLESAVDWALSGAEVGLPVGIAVVIGALFYIDSWWRWTDRLAMKILNRDTDSRARGRM